MTYNNRSEGWQTMLLTKKSNVSKNLRQYACGLFSVHQLRQIPVCNRLPVKRTSN